MNKREIQLQNHDMVHQSKVPKQDLAPHAKEVRNTIQNIKHK